MTYAINGQYGGRMSHSKYIKDNSVTYINIDYVTEGIGLPIHKVDGGR